MTAPGDGLVCGWRFVQIIFWCIVARYGAGHLLIIINTDPGWVHYSGDGALYTNFSMTTPDFIIFL